MKILIKNATIVDDNSTWHLQVVDVLLENGKIKKIDKKLSKTGTTIDGTNCYLSIGWYDMRALFGEPGLEYKETLDTGLEAAKAGGFTGISLFPNTEPVLQTKNDIAFVKNQTSRALTEVHPIAAVTKDCKGEDFSEMNDLKKAGAVAFSDGYKTIEHEDILMRTLMYLQKFDGILIHKPENKRLNMFGQMHEGPVSTSLGMKGLPAMAETITVLRDLELLKYAGGNLHLTAMSSADSIDLIRKAKKAGLGVTCDVSSYQTSFVDQDLTGFETNLKVSPPFREKKDKKAIIKGLKDGTIDVLTSGHVPHDEESKNLEFDLADAGIIGLQTVASNVVELMQDVGIEKLIAALTSNPRNILKLDIPTIEVGSEVNLTLLDPLEKWELNAGTNKSASKNSPYWNKTIQGKVKFVARKQQYYID